MISKSARELKKWSQFIINMRPQKGFEDIPNPDKPDYQQLDNWLAHPEKDSKANLCPVGIEESKVNEVPTFYIHPTTYFGADNWNADVNHLASRKMIEELCLPSQASIFNHLGEVYAPIYRQATFYSFLMSSNDAYMAFDLAYADVLTAFEIFLQQIGDKPYFIAGHSQGSLMGLKILCEKIEQDEHIRKRMVAAYLPGYKIPNQTFESSLSFIKRGEKPDQVHCVLAWDTFLDNLNPLHHVDNAATWIVGKSGGQWKRRLTYTPFCINPITWDKDKAESSLEDHLGAVVNEYDRKAFKWIDASNAENSGITTLSLKSPNSKMIKAKVGLGNLLYISKPKGHIYNIGKMPGGNYHVYDFTLFYMDIRVNASLRWASYKSLYLNNEPSTANT